jgi:hypothetical protein
LTIALLLIAAVAVFTAAFLLGRRHAAHRERARTLAQVLDAADALEARLRTARAEIEAIAGSEDNPVREALQEMLRQRLWLQQHGDAATLDQLSQVRDSIQAGSDRIDQQLARIERARAPSIH